jgi:hypothetical protein
MPAVPHDTTRRLLCLLLCLATWRGPVVWVHSHSDHESGEAAEMRLSSHLRRFHHERSSIAELPCWHLHIGLLRDLMADDPCDEGSGSEPTSDAPICLAPAPSVAALSALSLQSPLDLFVASSSERSSLLSSAAIPCGSFLQTYGDAPLRALTCVIRC